MLMALPAGALIAQAPDSVRTDSAAVETDTTEARRTPVDTSATGHSTAWVEALTMRNSPA